MAQGDIALPRSGAADAAGAPALGRARLARVWTDADFAAPVVNVLLVAITIAYAALFIYISWLRYHAFLMHAEDMGNMEQAVWNTAHGHPFHFNNLRQKWLGFEGAGTDTRLSFHVEPILLLVAIPYLVHASPLNLIVIQAIVVASGVFPAAWLARRHLRLPLAQLAFPLAYLLAPPLEAATLYEFHAVTMAAALLLWALYFADGARYRLFAVFAVLAMATKEEIGLVVALMGLWIWWRHRQRAIGLTTAILGVGWSLFCVLVIMRHFGPQGHSSPFCGRFNPYIMNGHNTGPEAQEKTCLGVAKLWMQHPDQVLSILVITQKLGFLHRMFITTGYLSLLSLPTLAISLFSYAIILFSNDVHMYSGVGHYPAELVPIMIGSAIFGVAWLANRLGPRLRVPPAATITVACAWLLAASVSNNHVNGFTPLSSSFVLPQTTHHVQVGQQILSLIPPNAPVAAGDYLDPHLSDRKNIYLFPDIGDAQYAVVDVSTDKFPYAPAGEQGVVMTMLSGGDWGVVRADDGYILMERRRQNPYHMAMGYNAHLPVTLPPAFYTFVTPRTTPHIDHPMQVKFGPSLELLGYNLQRREQVNLRLPDILLTTFWRLDSTVTEAMTPVVYMTNSAGAIDVQDPDHPGTDWLPMTSWPVKQTVRLESVPQTVFTNDNGKIDVDIAVYQPGTCGQQFTQWRAANPGLSASQFGCDLLTDAVHRYRPDVRSTPGHVPLEVVANGTILKLTQVTAHW